MGRFPTALDTYRRVQPCWPRPERLMSNSLPGDPPSSSRRQRRRAHPVRRRRRPLELETLERRDVPAGTWTPLANLAPSGAGSMMLLTDGTVLMQGGGSQQADNTWYQLTPTAGGDYINGTWSQAASMRLERLYFGSNVLPSGKAFVLGGEYSDPF